MTAPTVEAWLGPQSQGYVLRVEGCESVCTFGTYLVNTASSCDWCGEWLDEGHECDGDEPVDEEDDDGVHYSSYRPDWRPKGVVQDGPQFMGVELEVGGDWKPIIDAVHSVDADEDHLYLKEEGSIEGLEIVTHPMTLEWARQYPFPRLLDGLRKGGSNTAGCCDLHVHVDRGWFRSKAHAHAWTLFIYRNQGPLTQLSRNTPRSIEAWASFTAGNLEPGAVAKMVKGKSKGSRRVNGLSERYVAVNCNNERTYEVRFFKSTFDPGEFYGALEFVHASIEYARTIKARDLPEALDWNTFADWVAQRDYPNLQKELEKI